MTQGKWALVDESDYERVNAVPWTAGIVNGRWFAQRTERAGGAKRSVQMHRFILGAPDDVEIDHGNRDPLDNRRHNLRRATHVENSRNRRVRSDSRSGVKGVKQMPGGRWRARISFDGRKRHLGMFDTPEEAAVAYARAAHEHFGAFAAVGASS